MCGQFDCGLWESGRAAGGAQNVSSVVCDGCDGSRMVY